MWGWVYVLKLQDDCWYVGYSADPETRIACHFLGRGARWTQIHPPIAVESLQPGTKKLEDVITIALMVRHMLSLGAGQAVRHRGFTSPAASHCSCLLDQAPCASRGRCSKDCRGDNVRTRCTDDASARMWRNSVDGENCWREGVEMLPQQRIQDDLRVR